MIARWLAAWRRMRLEAELIQIDREIDALRAWRIAERVREAELVNVRSEFARRLQAMKYGAIERRTAANVRAMK